MIEMHALRAHVREYQTFRGKLQNVKSIQIFILDRH